MTKHGIKRRKRPSVEDVLFHPPWFFFFNVSTLEAELQYELQ